VVVEEVTVVFVVREEDAREPVHTTEEEETKAEETETEARCKGRER